MSGPAAASLPAPAAGGARAPLWAGLLLLLTLAGALALRSGGLGHGLDRTEHALRMAEAHGQDAEGELAVTGGRLATLLLPGLFAHLRAGDRVLPGGNLPARGLLGPWLPWHALYLGWLPLLLALLALFDPAAGGRAAPLTWLFRLAALAGLVRVGLQPAALGSPWVLPLLTGLAGLAACGLASLLSTPGRVAPAMLLAVAALALAAAQILWALAAGAGSDETALRPWLALVDGTSAAHVTADPTLTALNAQHLRAVLDQAALTGFVSLCALLWFLKRRDAAATAVLLLAVAGDFAWHHLTLA